MGKSKDQHLGLVYYERRKQGRLLP